MDSTKYQKFKEIYKKSSRLKGKKKLEYLNNACKNDSELKKLAQSISSYDSDKQNL